MLTSRDNRLNSCKQNKRWVIMHHKCMKVLLSLALSSTHNVTASKILSYRSSRSLQYGLITTSWTSPSGAGLETIKSLLCNYTLLSLLYRLERPIIFLPHSKWTLYYNSRLIIQSGSWVSFSHMWPPLHPWQTGPEQVVQVLSGYPGRKALGNFRKIVLKSIVWKCFL